MVLVPRLMMARLPSGRETGVVGCPQSSTSYSLFRWLGSLVSFNLAAIVFVVDASLNFIRYELSRIQPYKINSSS